MTTANGTPLRAWLRGCPPSDGAWWRRCACGAPLAFSELACTGCDRHPQPPPPVQLYATETGSELTMLRLSWRHGQPKFSSCYPDSRKVWTP